MGGGEKTQVPRAGASCWFCSFLTLHPTWIHDILHQADKNKDNKMSFKEIKNMLRMINIDMNDIYAYRLFKVIP